MNFMHKLALAVFPTKKEEKNMHVQIYYSFCSFSLFTIKT